MATRLKNMGLRIRRLWWKVKYFINGDTRRDKRERKQWAALARKARMSMIAEDLQEEREARQEILAESVADRPYKDCMTDEHFDVIMRNRVVEVEREGHKIYEVNTKGMDAWEVDEFWAMLREKTKLHKPTPIIREVVSYRFPQ